MPHSADPGLIGGRYLDIGPIGMGGMGEVRRVRDVALNRTLAMKIIHARLVEKPVAVARFLDEAQATGQLQHPGIVPVHDVGTLPDGRSWFTMKEVRGRTLTEVVREVHAASTDRWSPGASGFTFRRLVASFAAACHAVAYAHERGVVHRDLKPENVMIGAHGEVMVLDWGLAKVLDRGDPTGAADPEPESEAAVVSHRSDRHATRTGTVAGTPAYMPPEQARGETDRLDQRADVYALGAMLYEIMSGRPPYEGTPLAVLRQVVAGPPVPVGRSALEATFSFSETDEGRHDGPPLPGELVAACERAMARDPDARFPTALALAGEVEVWLDGARRREQALALVERAPVLVAESEALMVRAGALQAESDALLADVPAWAPEELKAPAWEIATQAEAARVAAEMKDFEAEQALRAALQIASDLPEAHAALAEWHLARHALAEASREPLARVEALLRHHAHALPDSHPARQRVTRYLAGHGALTLVTDPPGAEVMLHRYVERNRRLVEEPVRSLGRTPLLEVSLPMGSYLAVLRHPDRAEVRYPFEIRRHDHWDGVPPGEQEAAPVWLPPVGLFGPDEIYVPAGRFRAGGDPDSVSFRATRLWCDALVIDRFPVTNREFLAFLDALVVDGREEEAWRYVPRERAGAEGEVGAPIYGFDGRRFGLRADADGDAWPPDFPVLQVDWHGARALLSWRAVRTGRPWRLPCELEWEKAARGVDGRWYPWGDHLDPSWCRLARSARGREQGDFGPVVVDSYPVDVSPYGVRGMGGNAQDWCLDRFDPGASVREERVTPPVVGAEPSRMLRAVRGGTWLTDVDRYARASTRLRYVPTYRGPHMGFRGVFRPLPSDS